MNNHNIDLDKYQIRTDLAIEALEGIKESDGIVTNVEEEDNIKITTVDVLEKGTKLINKKEGRYITIEFDDLTTSLIL